MRETFRPGLSFHTKLIYIGSWQVSGATLTSKAFVTVLYFVRQSWAYSVGNAFEMNGLILGRPFINNAPCIVFVQEPILSDSPVLRSISSLIFFVKRDHGHSLCSGVLEHAQIAELEFV